MQEQGRERNKCEAVLICRSFDVECVANAIDVFVSLSIRLSGTAVFIENEYSCLICHKSELFKFNFVILDIVDIAPLCCCVVADLWMLAMMMTLFVACYVEFLVLFLLLFCSFFLFNIFVLYVLISFLQFITVCVEHIRGICVPPASPWSGGCDFSQVIE